jgi:hypothetical protein
MLKLPGDMLVVADEDERAFLRFGFLEQQLQEPVPIVTI